METMAATKPYTTFNRLQIFLHALVFVLGFSLVFIVGWGGTATVLGQWFGQYKRTGHVAFICLFDWFGAAIFDIGRWVVVLFLPLRPAARSRLPGLSQRACLE